MEKQEAIELIHQKLKEGCDQAEITAELSRKLGVPSDIVGRFVTRVIDQSPLKTVEPSTPLKSNGETLHPETEFTGTSSSIVPVNSAPATAVHLKEKKIVFLQYESRYTRLSAQDRLKISFQMSWKRLRENWKIFSRNRFALLGIFLLIFYLILALVQPVLLKTVWPKGIYDPVTGYDVDIFPHPSGISKAHLLGTDTLGRDVMSLLMAATRPVLLMALVTTLTATLLGTFIGAVSAYYRGIIDGFFTNLGDLALLAPAPLIMVIIGFILDIRPVQFGLIYGLLAGIGVVSIVIRSHAMQIVSKSYIHAAQVAGGSSFHILVNHVIPHLLPLAAISMLFTVTGAIFASGFIAFLGLSRAQLNWGSMIYDAFTYEGINGILPWNVLIPSALAISLFAAAFYLIALGLRDVVEPRHADRTSRHTA